MARTTISITKEALHFAAAHFTIFSATERENLHGHNFQVAADIDADVGEDGLAFDYNLIKRTLQTLCDGLDERTLLPGRSPHLAIKEEQGYTVAIFDDERIPFLPRDVLTLPVANITVEALADWLGGELFKDPDIATLDMHRLTVKVSSGAGQWAQSSFAPEASIFQRETAESIKKSAAGDNPATGIAAR
ncbi:MAG: 6-carboxytetrahydropterin synthase [Gammaproteobacteria bacterium]|nr:6-carboxytetrahydropterin synthase [Gammaproteobacteria bacterium]MDE0364666.1 6-carboxytetrahydropterin synthase [Gammaproteobacteria bacterium]